MKKKMQEGCGYFLTQPIYSEEDVERIQYLKEQTGAKICCGIMPLVSYKNAYFIANEMPGIRVPKEIVDAYKEDMTREESEAIAVEISLSIARKLYSIADGFYFMTPFNRVSLICRIIDRIREEL
jgi:homocysteine S-methyltransferase